MVRHLTEGVPPIVLAKAAGLTDATSVARYVQFMPDFDYDDAVAWLQGSQVLVHHGSG
jgi:hypothetical protein